MKRKFNHVSAIDDSHNIINDNYNKTKCKKISHSTDDRDDIIMICKRNDLVMYPNKTFYFCIFCGYSSSDMTTHFINSPGHSKNLHGEHFKYNMRTTINCIDDSCCHDGDVLSTLHVFDICYRENLCNNLAIVKSQLVRSNCRKNKCNPGHLFDDVPDKNWISSSRFEIDPKAKLIYDEKEKQERMQKLEKKKAKKERNDSHQIKTSDIVEDVVQSDIAITYSDEGKY
jgi:hypothetical protein